MDPNLNYSTNLNKKDLTPYTKKDWSPQEHHLFIAHFTSVRQCLGTIKQELKSSGSSFVALSNNVWEQLWDLCVKFAARVMGMFLKLLIICLVLVGAAVAGLSIRILLKPNGRFPETHIGKNREMKKLGLKCAQHTDIGCNGLKNRPECSECEKRL